jgi:crotonobetainyl-CoA:carnitine CoA-transferase CaiB-like acyl-CoA transferase
MQACGGLMSITGGQDAPPTRSGPSIVDLGTGMWAAIGILAALYRRRTTGDGAIIDCSLFETAIGLCGVHIVNYLASGAMPARSANGFPGLAPYGGYPTVDGEVIIGAGNDRLFQKLADLLGRPGWKDDPRFGTNVGRVAHREELDREITALTRLQPAEALLALLEGGGVPCAPIRTVPELTRDAQVAALGLIGTLPGTPAYPVVKLPLSFDGERPQVLKSTPHPGEHSAELTRMSRNEWPSW